MQDEARTDPPVDVVITGVGGAGGNALNLIASQGLDNAQFVVADANPRTLHRSRASIYIDLSDPTASVNPVPHRVSLANTEEIVDSSQKVFQHLTQHPDARHIMFILCGEGGTTGTVATPIIAQEARRYGYTVVAIATQPFSFEGAQRTQIAQAGIDQLTQAADATIVIPNDYLLNMPEVNGIVRAFHMADMTIRSIVLAIVHDVATTNTTVIKAADRVRRCLERHEPLVSQ